MRRYPYEMEDSADADSCSRDGLRARVIEHYRFLTGAAHIVRQSA